MCCFFIFCPIPLRGTKNEKATHNPSDPFGHCALFSLGVFDKDPASAPAARRLPKTAARVACAPSHYGTASRFSVALWCRVAFLRRTMYGAVSRFSVALWCRVAFLRRTMVPRRLRSAPLWCRVARAREGCARGCDGEPPSEQGGAKGVTSSHGSKKEARENHSSTGIRWPISYACPRGTVQNVPHVACGRAERFAQAYVNAGGVGARRAVLGQENAGGGGGVTLEGAYIAAVVGDAVGVGCDRLEAGQTHIR